MAYGQMNSQQNYLGTPINQYECAAYCGSVDLCLCLSFVCLSVCLSLSLSLSLSLHLSFSLVHDSYCGHMCVMWKDICKDYVGMDSSMGTLLGTG